MREIVLDTETTGLDPDAGDRIVEIGAVELVNHMPTGRTFHAYINPQRDVPQEAVDGPRADRRLPRRQAGLRRGRRRVRRLHRRRAAGDPQCRLRHEVPERRARLGRAAELSPGRGRSTRWSWRGGASPARRTRLDALCRRFGVDNSGREKHGALLDSELLAEVYLELMGGRQPDLMLTVVAAGRRPAPARSGSPPPRPRPLAPRLTAAEAEAHAPSSPTLGDGPRSGCSAVTSRGQACAGALARLGLAARQLRPVERRKSICSRFSGG